MPSKLPERLAARRHELRLSRKLLAQMIGGGDAQIWRYENGKSDPTGETIIKLCDVLHVSADWLLGRYDEDGEQKGRGLHPADFSALSVFASSPDSPDRESLINHYLKNFSLHSKRPAFEKYFIDRDMAAFKEALSREEPGETPDYEAEALDILRTKNPERQRQILEILRLL